MKCHDNIEEDSQSSLLKFGSAKPIMANKSVKLPVKFGDRNVKLKCEVLPVKVPLLLSNDTLYKSGTIIDVSNQKITMYGKEVPVKRKSNVHFIINIMREKELGKKQQEEETEDEFVKENIILMLTEETLDEKALLKVHKQFGHSSYKNIVGLLKAAGKDSANNHKTLKKVISKCDGCERYKKTPQIPKICLP